MKRLKIGSLVLALVITLTACRGGLHTSIWAPRALVQAVGAINLPDGVYPGSGPGFAGDVHVEVTIEGNAIVEIVVTGHSDTAAFANSVFSSLIPEIKARQVTSVDAISGATHTAEGFIDAVEDALVSGGADLASIRRGAATAAAVSSTPASIIKGELTGNVDVGEFAPFTPGTYEGFGTGGYSGNVIVAVTFDESRITALEVIHSDETPLFGEPAFTALIPRVLQAQTYEVDVLTGATYSSEAFLDAIADAVDQASEW